MTSAVKKLETQVPASLSVASAERTGDLVIAPQNFGEVMAFAGMMAESMFVPAAHRGKPGNCLAICMQALRWSLDPFMVAQKTYFVKDGAPPAYEAQLINAVVYARAPLDGRLHIEWSGKWPERICTVTGFIKGDPKPHTREVRGAGITTRNSPLWKTDPDQQLAYYATRAWARLYCPDVIMGAYTRDEIAEGAHVAPENARDITPTAEPAKPTRLDALEEVIGKANPWDEETGEITEPAERTGVAPAAAGQDTAKAADAPAQPAPEILADAGTPEARLAACTTIDQLKDLFFHTENMQPWRASSGGVAQAAYNANFDRIKGASK